MGEIVSGSKLKKNIGKLLILIISGAVVYTLPYVKNYYYDTYVAVYGLTNMQMGALGSAYGGFAMIAYFFGGFVTDRWSPKYLLSVSLVVSGGLGLLMLATPPYPVLLAIHGGLGITTILTFWNPLMKAIRMLANPDEQGKAFGLFEGGRGITNMVQSALILALFAAVAAASTDARGLTTIITVYAIANIIFGVLVFFLLQDEGVSKDEKKLFNWSAFKRAAKLPTTWLQILIIFCSYATIINYFYITPYATSVFGASVVIGAAVGYMSQYCRPIGCFLTGIFADKLGSSKMLSIVYIIMIVGLVGVVVTPGNPSFIWMLLLFMAAIYASMYGIQSMHFAIMEEGDYPVEIMGAAMSIITPLGYSAELICPLIAGYCLDKWEGPFGYKVFFIFLIVLAVIGLGATFVWMAKTKVRRTAILNKKVKA